MVPISCALSVIFCAFPRLAVAQLLDLVRGARGRIGRDPLEHRDPLLEPAHLALQAVILVGQQLDPALGIRAALVALAAPFVLQRIAVPRADPAGSNPAKGGDRNDRDNEKLSALHVDSLLPQPWRSCSISRARLFSFSTVI